jgi:diguanylate cyclase (GGDEF)-like protein/PAS domain S-box-containing protein
MAIDFLWLHALALVATGAALSVLVTCVVAGVRGRRTKAMLREQNIRLDAALNNMTQGVNMFDANGRLVLVNERYIEMYGLSHEIVKPGMTVREMVEHRVAAGTFFKADPEEYIGQLTTSMIERKPNRTIRELNDGRVVTVVNQQMEDGGWVVTHEDVTERSRADRELERTRNFLHTVIENVPSPIIVKDARDLTYVLINRAGEEFYEVAREKMIGKTTVEIMPAASAEAIAGYDRHLLNTLSRQFVDEHPLELPNGRKRIVTTMRLPIIGDDGKPQYLVTVLQDVTEHRRAEARIAHLRHYDSLTDLPNRAAFNECLAAMLERAVKSGEPFALLYIDLDRFKDINEVFGHAIGDQLIRAISRRLSSEVEGAFLARLGGDEFSIIVTQGPQPEAAAQVAERLLAIGSEDFEIDGHQVRAGLSVGTVISPTDGIDAPTLIDNVEAALYQAKSSGRGAMRFFEPGMDQLLRERRAFVQDLQLALTRAEFTVHYQPQARIDGEIVGFEALARWRHPTRGVVPPETFIPILEESGLILALGEWILREACREAASWPRKLNIAVNLSPAQFRHGDLVGLVHEVLLDTGLAANRLELEITENVLIDDLARALSILRRLKALGLRIAMDDFGTGYSSLSNLQAFPFDKIKIDRSFISNLERSPQSATIVRAVIGLGRGLDLPVIAEGVETAAQLAFLVSEACSEVQGYLIGRPRPIEEQAELVGRKARLGRAHVA